MKSDFISGHKANPQNTKIKYDKNITKILQIKLYKIYHQNDKVSIKI